MAVRLDQATSVLGGDRPPIPQMNAFIEEYREAYGVEPTCQSLRRPDMRTPPPVRSRTT